MQWFLNFVKVALFLYALDAFGQIGQYDPSKDWRTLKTERGQIIFPKKSESIAFRMASIMERIDKINPQAHKTSPAINVILQNTQVFSNGMVGLFPFRSHFYHKPRNDFNTSGTVDWIDRLTLHEYRHIYQFLMGYKYNKIAKVLQYLWGEMGWAPIFAVAPDWYFEGNAVWHETIYSHSGRGRTAYFFKEQRALYADGIRQSYSKARNGSYKDIVPNHYRFGYAMNRYLFNHYGAKTIDAIFRYAITYRQWIAPFYKGVKTYTGLNSSGLYKKAYQEMGTHWAKMDAQSPKLPTGNPLKVKKSKTVTDYSFPQKLADGSIIALKKSYQELPHLVRIQNGKEQKIISLDLSPQSYFNTNGNKAVWTVLSKNWRYDNVAYSDLVLYDLKTKQRKIITHHKRYFSPNIADDGRIVCVAQSEGARQYLIIINPKNGEVQERISLEVGANFSYPQWQGKQQLIYLKRLHSRVAFFSYHLGDKKEAQITDWTTTPIGFYDVDEKGIYYSASYHGTDNIYHFDFKTKATSLISSAKAGFYQPHFADGALLVSDFTRRGHRITRLPIKKGFVFDEHKIPTDSIYLIKTNRYEDFLDNIPAKTYKHQAYKGTFKDFKFYRWGVLLGQRSKTIYPLLSVDGANLFGDLSANFKLEYLGTEKKVRYNFEARYSKYPPVFSLSLKNGNRATLRQQNHLLYLDNFNQFDYGLSVALPLKQFHRNYRFDINAKATYNLLNNRNIQQNDVFNKSINTTPNQWVSTVGVSLSLMNTQNKAYQNVKPRFAQQLSFSYRQALNYRGSFKRIKGSFYFPGIHRNHSLNAHLFWKHQSAKGAYQHSENLLYARGYDALYSETLHTLQLNYELPIAYPDMGVLNAYYLKRIRANLFYDQTSLNAAYYAKKDRTFRTVGTSFVFDSTLFNILPFSIGVIPQYLLDEKEGKQFLMGFSFRLNF